MKKNRVKKICVICNKEFEKTPSLSHVKTCSKKCGYKLKSTYPSWNKGLTKEDSESIRRISEAKKGEKNPAKRKEVRKKISQNMREQYASGKRDRHEITKKANEARRVGDTHQNFRKRIFNFYPNICAICGSKQNLEAHHIVPQEYDNRRATGKGNHHVSNGIILCRDCHQDKVHKERSKRF